jgi:hypothetical protein
MINIINEVLYPTLWNNIIEDYYDTTEKDHRRGSSFYCEFIFEINEEYFPDNPELHGFWISNTIIWDDSYGIERKDIIELIRAEKKKVVIEKEKWVPVEVK